MQTKPSQQAKADSLSHSWRDTGADELSCSPSLPHCLVLITMRAQRRRRSSLLLLSLLSCSASAVVAGESTAHNVLSPDESRPTAGNKYHVSEGGRAINNKEKKIEDRKSLRGLKHAHATNNAESNENTNAAPSQRIISDMIDLAAPLYDEAVIPSPLEDRQDVERDLKKDEDKNDKKDKKDDKEVTVIQPKSHSIIGTGNSVYHVSGGVIDLTNAPIKIPPSTPAQCFETKPYMGCDRGGADNQRLVFFGHDFGMGCAQADPCLFALMPIRMAYYCPKHGRPLCGGKCYNVAQHCPDNGILVDRNGTAHNVTDAKWGEANADAWNYWPANFGCPSCVS